MQFCCKEEFWLDLVCLFYGLLLNLVIIYALKGFGPLFLKAFLQNPIKCL